MNVNSVLMNQILQVYDSDIGLRMGIVLVNSKKNTLSRWETAPLFDRAARAFKLIREYYGSKSSYIFLSKVLSALHEFQSSDEIVHNSVQGESEKRRMKEDEIILHESLSELIEVAKPIDKESALTVEKAKEYLQQDNMHSHLLHLSTNHLINVGLIDEDSFATPEMNTNIMVINGVIVKENEAQGGFLNVAIMYMQQVYQKLAKDLYYENIDIDDNNYYNQRTDKNQKLTKEKFDVSDIGHCSGTGLVNFGSKHTIELI